MADNDQYNDEYQFADPDAVGANPLDAGQSYDEAVVNHESRVKSGANSVISKAIMVVAILIIALILYKFLGSYFSKPTKVIDTPRTEIVPMTIEPISTVPSVSVPSPTAVAIEPEITQKLSLIDSSQQNLRSEIVSISNQLTGVNTSINALSSQIEQLNRMISALSVRIDEQAGQLDKLTIRNQPKPTKKITHRVMVPGKKYYIQAVIPGRAWLIAQNGTTLTVREGSEIPGYGTVKLIDPNQGRITTSSGQIIKFSQTDS